MESQEKHFQRYGRPIDNPTQDLRRSTINSKFTQMWDRLLFIAEFGCLTKGVLLLNS